MTSGDAHEHQHGRDNDREAALEPTWRADTDDRADQQSELRTTAFHFTGVETRRTGSVASRWEATRSAPPGRARGTRGRGSSTSRVLRQAPPATGSRTRTEAGPRLVLPAGSGAGRSRLVRRSGFNRRRKAVPIGVHAFGHARPRASHCRSVTLEWPLDRLARPVARFVVGANLSTPSPPIDPHGPETPHVVPVVARKYRVQQDRECDHTDTKPPITSGQHATLLQETCVL